MPTIVVPQSEGDVIVSNSGDDPIWLERRRGEGLTAGGFRARLRPNCSFVYRPGEIAPAMMFIDGPVSITPRP